MAAPLLRCFPSRNSIASTSCRLMPFSPRPTRYFSIARISRIPHRSSSKCRAQAAEISISSNAEQLVGSKSSKGDVIVLDVNGMMCAGCAARVRSLLESDERVESATVNMLSEMAAVRLKSFGQDMQTVASELSILLTECGFPTKNRSFSSNMRSSLKKWAERTLNKKLSLERSRNNVAFAWTLVAVCCGSHAAHFLHSIGIHVAHGSFWGFLDNIYVKAGIALSALLGPGREILIDGFRALTKSSPNMNSLVGLGAVVSFVISLISLAFSTIDWHSTFFDEPVMLLGFVLLGRSLEERARLEACSDMNDLLSLASSQTRLVISAEGGTLFSKEAFPEEASYFEVPTDDIRPGDSVIVLPGETIPIDGKVVAGTSVVDESMLTGEPFPVRKASDCCVTAGTVNWEGPLRIEATTSGATSTISKILNMVEEAQSQQAPVQRLADMIAGPFAYIVMTISAATFAFWYYLGTSIFPDVLLNDISGSDASSLLLSLKLATNVLVVACPCALGLATPTAVLIGTSLGAKQGLLIRGGNVLEKLASIDIAAFDKTGTLTEGRPAVVSVFALHYDEGTILRLAAAVERTTNHPIAKAIVEKAEHLKLDVPSTEGQITEPGLGALAEIDGKQIAVGSIEWTNKCFKRQNKDSDIRNLVSDLFRKLSVTKKYLALEQSVSQVYVSEEGKGIIGAILVSDSLRSDARNTITRLQKMGIQTIMLSGDREEAVAKVAETVGINGKQHLHSCLKPIEKRDAIASLQKQGHTITMVGDGVNDAPALAVADVGVALRLERREDAASDAASVVLLGNRLFQLVEAIELSRATMNKVKQNLAWAIAYNTLAIPVAAGVLLPSFDFALTPPMAGGMMAFSSVLVVTNSLLLQFQAGHRQGKLDVMNDLKMELTEKLST
eukprot:TRINITY_DN4135_c0_g1_i1.p1 TRINITY_DN4135_c0_g1~~TRINITY_DN4135_c0_g1_i1.p1  ORF type:complete len:935 (+),score=209.97 TRINITY_DN4135_c0_g1_i1:106-2805(+)